MINLCHQFSVKYLLSGGQNELRVHILSSLCVRSHMLTYFSL